MIAGVVPGGPAATAGLVPGDVITAVRGDAVSGPSGIASIVLAHKVGDTITIMYTDTGGAAQTVTVTLGNGPPQ